MSDITKAAAAAALALGLSTGAAQAADPENMLVLETANGRVLIEMLPDVAPNHVERIKTLAREGFYDGNPFHRVIAEFMAQTGDPTGTGAGGSKLPNLKAEFSAVPFERGTLGMARSQNPDSANSQFFIVFQRAPWLDGEYTVVGKVVDGMDVVDRIKKGDQARNGAVQSPDKIVSLKVLADTQ